jgi:MoxR-like ATPase
MLLRAARVAAWLQGRDFMTPDDVQSVWSESIAHRVFFTPVYEMRRAELAGELMREIIHHVVAP